MSHQDSVKPSPWLSALVDHIRIKYAIEGVFIGRRIDVSLLSAIRPSPEHFLRLAHTVDGLSLEDMTHFLQRLCRSRLPYTGAQGELMFTADGAAFLADALQTARRFLRMHCCASACSAAWCALHHLLHPDC